MQEKIYPDAIKADGVDWDEWLKEYVKESMRWNNYDGPCQVIEDILGLNTYDGEASYIIVGKMLNTIKHIINKTTFEFIRSKKNNIEYLTMVNLPRIADYIEWGTSIRSAWFQHSDFIFYPDQLCNDVNGVVYYIADQPELHKFWYAVIRLYKTIK